MNSVPMRSYPTRGYRSAPVWLAVSTEHFDPRARSSRNMRHNSAWPMPRRRCDGSTYISAHHVAPAASTLRTRPTIFSPSNATYWRNGASSASRSFEIGRVRVTLPSAPHVRECAPARSGCEAAALEFASGAARRILRLRAGGNRAPCRRSLSIRPAGSPGSSRKQRSALGYAAARSHRLARGLHRVQSIPLCDSRADSCGAHRASPIPARRGSPHRERCGSGRRCARGRTLQSRIPFRGAVWSSQR
jgi:hypothetical protein